MARSRFCRVCKDFHDLEQAWPSACLGHFGHLAEDAGFYIQSDTIDAFRSMADGKVYDSKSQYRRDLKARGLVELGNDTITQRPVHLSRDQRRADIQRTIHQLRERA